MPESLVHYSLVFDSEELPCLSYVYYRNTLPYDSLYPSALQLPFTFTQYLDQFLNFIIIF